MKIKGRILLAALLAAALLTGCAREEAETKIEPQGLAYFAYFDTVSYVYSYAGDPAEQFQERSAAVSALLGEYHQLFDIYHGYSGVNNLYTINQNAGGEPLQVDRKLIDFLLYAKELYGTTGGEMNVMMGSVLRLWHDCREAAGEDPQSAQVPGEQQLREAAEHMSIDSLEIDEQNCTVRITDPQAFIDVGALGKGYAVEQAARLLEEEGALGYVLNVGGNIRIIGTRPDGSGWVTGIRDPENSDEAFALTLNIKATACVTSGIYERYFVVDGERYHHIIDKDTLYPADYFASVTVLTPDSGLADALSTALFCMGYEEGLALAESLGADAVWIFNDGEIRCTPGAQELIVEES